VVVAKFSADLKRLIWCTYVGGSGNETPRGGLAVDAADNIYVVGSTQSADFPTTPGVVGSSAKGDHDAFIVKLKSDGSGLVWSTRLGGRASEVIMGIRVDPAGNLYVAGHTQSDDFRVTAGAAQLKRKGSSDAFVVKLVPVR
jgi:outer membrane protein assembly factor BamB